MYNYYLRGLIINAGMTQKHFAAILGISNATLTNIISGKTKKEAHRQLIADYFDKPIQSIFRGRK